MTDIPRRLGGPFESRLDRAIDRAVHDMMHVDPRPGFRRRVLAHLGSEPVHSSALLRVGLGAAALAVLVLAVMVFVPDRRSGLPHAVAEHETAPTQVSLQPAAPATTAGQAPRGQKRTPGVTTERIPMPRVTNVFGERRNAAAATSIDTDTVWPASPAVMHEDPAAGPPPLVIPPLDAPAPIVIAPLNPRGPGNL
jgi:hypothetical protein